jgi:hypothetical protein
MVQSTRPGGYEAYPKSNSLECNATRLGQATVSSSLAPEDGFFIHRELHKSLGSFVMGCDMQALYAFTRLQVAYAHINWQIFRKEVEALDGSDMKVLFFVGLNPAIISKV